MVYFDIRIGLEPVGRIVIELRKDVVPQTAENFRSLCCGAVSRTSKKPLTYTGTKIHKVQRAFAICGGVIGKIGESIYGTKFPDENFDLMVSSYGVSVLYSLTSMSSLSFQHTTGAVSMANYGPNTNNSQFFITNGECPHLDGSHVVCGYVLRGLGVISEMEKVANDEGQPMEEIVIERSGEIESNQNWGHYDEDDNLPPFPIDWDEHETFLQQTPKEVLTLLESIKKYGNNFYSSNDHVNALRKYKKVVRYSDAHASGSPAYTPEDSQLFTTLRLENLLNMAACYLKLQRWKEVQRSCTDVIRGSPNQSKAFYRRGVAEIEMKEYESGLEDLKRAHSLAPNDPRILEQFNRGKALLLEYRKTEKSRSQMMFKDLNL